MTLHIDSNIGNGEYNRTVKDALTLRDGPIWWHYQSVSGIVNNLRADGDIPHFGGRLRVRRGAGRDRGNYKLVEAVGRAIECTGSRLARWCAVI